MPCLLLLLLLLPYSLPSHNEAFLIEDSCSEVDTPYCRTRHKTEESGSLKLSGCTPARDPPSTVQHSYAEEGLEVTKLAFSSCYVPANLEWYGNTFWSQVRQGSPDLFLWLGDNMYADGTDINWKRLKYNEARTEASYVSDGPVKEGAKIPVMATWDDHDCCSNNLGNDFPCLKEAQDEFVTHFNLPPSSPLHWEHPGGQQAGVYNARMFLQPGTQKNGLQVIMLDARSGRDPTYPSIGECRGAESKMMNNFQWQWLEERLNLQSEVTIIASGTQVLPPTSQTTSPSSFCSHDSQSGGGTTFQDAIAQVGEGPLWPGTDYESWGEIPQERAKLLGLVQRAINEGNTKTVIFVSGDQHWAELMAKRMPDSEAYGPSQVLYEVTASGVYQDFNYDVVNANRLRNRSCDRQGEGPYNRGCVFPFRYQGETYTDCAPLYAKDRSNTSSPSKTLNNSNTSRTSSNPSPTDTRPSGWVADSWCSTLTDSADNHQEGYWGNCGPIDQELVQTAFSSTTHGCSESQFHICRAASNYGYIEVDFAVNKVTMGIRTPEEREEAYHTIVY